MSPLTLRPEQLTDYSEAPLFLQLSPTNTRLASASATGDLPLVLYESVVEIVAAAPASNSTENTNANASEDAPGGGTAAAGIAEVALQAPAPAQTATATATRTYFVPAAYRIESGEAERIAVDHTTRHATSSTSSAGALFGSGSGGGGGGAGARGGKEWDAEAASCESPRLAFSL